MGLFFRRIFFIYFILGFISLFYLYKILSHKKWYKLLLALRLISIFPRNVLSALVDKVAKSTFRRTEGEEYNFGTLTIPEAPMVSPSGIAPTAGVIISTTCLERVNLA